MARLNLRILRGKHGPCAAVGYPVPSVRVFTRIALSAKSGLAEFPNAVVDTGAPVSLFPAFVWHGTEFVPLARLRIGGVAHREKCKLDALAELDCVLSDEATTIGPFRIHAFLADSDAVPILLGIAGILEHLKLTVDLPRNVAYLDGP